MKKIFLSLFFCSGLILSTNAEAPCPTGYSSVEHSQWPWNNHTTYTMCGCQAVEGYSASGSCGGGPPE